MFKVMNKLRMPNSFINMITLLFQNVVVSINIYNQVVKLLGIHRNACQGCPLAPHMFIIVVVKNAVRTSLLKATSNAIPNKYLVNMLRALHLLSEPKSLA